METFDFFRWHWWIAAALILFIAEIMLPGFWVLCLGIGAVGGAIAAALGLDPNWQLLFFSVFSLVAFFAIRPVLMKRERNRPVMRTNVDALQGMRGKVTQDFEPGLRLGRVAVGGDDWRALAIDDRMLRVGDVIEVVSVESNTVVVRSIDPT